MTYTDVTFKTSPPIVRKSLDDLPEKSDEDDNDSDWSQQLSDEDHEDEQEGKEASSVRVGMA